MNGHGHERSRWQVKIYDSKEWIKSFLDGSCGGCKWYLLAVYELIKYVFDKKIKTLLTSVLMS